MADSMGERRHDLMRRLRNRRTGMTIDELADALQITRPAVRQHLSSLERDGLVCSGEQRATQGRPVQTYRLSADGWECFPKQYAWFSGRLLESIRTEKGSTGLVDWLRDLSRPIASSMQHRMAGKSFPARVEEAVGIMNELAYEASVTPGTSDEIVATNCVYHGLATQIPEVCQFDLELIEQLTGAAVNHQECLVKGGNVCRFKLEPKGAPGPDV